MGGKVKISKIEGIHDSRHHHHHHQKKKKKKTEDRNRNDPLLAIGSFVCGGPWMDEATWHVFRAAFFLFREP